MLAKFTIPAALVGIGAWLIFEKHSFKFLFRWAILEVVAFAITYELISNKRSAPIVLR